MGRDPPFRRCLLCNTEPCCMVGSLPMRRSWRLADMVVEDAALEIVASAVAGLLRIGRRLDADRHFALEAGAVRWSADEDDVLLDHPEKLRSLTLHGDALLLCQWAKSGEGNDRTAFVALMELEAALRGSDADPYRERHPDPSVAALDYGWFDMVRDAAHARFHLAGEGRGPVYVDVEDVAVLASLAPYRVRQLLRTRSIRGRLAGGRWRIRNADARRWLAARGAPGFVVRPVPRGT